MREKKVGVMEEGEWEIRSYEKRRKGMRHEIGTLNGWARNEGNTGWIKISSASWWRLYLLGSDILC